MHTRAQQVGVYLFPTQPAIAGNSGGVFVCLDVFIVGEEVFSSFYVDTLTGVLKCFTDLVLRARGEGGGLL